MFVLFEMGPNSNCTPQKYRAYISLRRVLMKKGTELSLLSQNAILLFLAVIILCE
jgi:hypothetical protein